MTDRGSPLAGGAGAGGASAGGAGAGAVVARGKIKVDGGKAIRKLRDHLLVDLHLYATEIARVAMALGARALHVTWDADDVVLTWAGRALPAAAIARVRDHVLTPEHDPEHDASDGDALRVLGIGVSAALGLDPAFVDVYSADAASCARVRFESKHIDEDAAAAAPTPVVVARPPDLDGPGMRVHVRRRVGMQVLARAVRRDMPREVTLLAQITHDAALTITIDGISIDGQSGPRVLVSVDLDEPSVRRASLEILQLTRGFGPRTVFHELGVELTQVSSIGVPAFEETDLPLRVVIDGQRLPTNASRSEVRMDAEVVQRIRARVPAAFDAALEALTAFALHGRAATTSETGHSVQVMAGPRELFVDALGAIAAAAALAMSAGKSLSARQGGLLALPLLSNAIGEPMSLADLRGGTAEQPLLVYTGPSAAAADLGVWLSGIVWQRGATAERAFAALVLASANERVLLAAHGRERQRRAFEHPPARPVLPPAHAYVLKEAFAVREGPFAGLEGEVAVARPASGYRRSSTARLFVDDRLLETVQLPGVALPVDMALSWPTGIRARWTYDAVERDERLSHAIVYALRVAALAVGERLATSDAELTRLAVVAYASATKTLGDRAATGSGLGDLATRAIWPAPNGKLLTLAAIETYANRTGALCVARSGNGEAVDRRPVLAAEHANAVLGLLRDNTQVIDYTRALAQPREAADEALALQALPSPLRVPIEREDVIGFVGVGPNRRRVFHAGILLRDEAYAYRNGPVLVAIEDRAAVPTADYDALRWSSPGASSFAREEDALLESVIDACERGTLERSVVEDYLEVAARKLKERVHLARPQEDQAWLNGIVQRLAELSQRVEENRRAKAKALVLSRPVRRPRSLDDATAAKASTEPHATVSTPAGSVTVTLVRDGDPAATSEITFEGHLVDTSPVLPLSVSVVADANREDYFEEWTSLTAEGARWAKTTAMLATLKMLGELATFDGFAFNAAVLRLCVQIVALESARSSSVAEILRKVRWPTVQAGTTSLVLAGGQPTGAEAFVPYRFAREPSPYDAPALLLSRDSIGELRKNALLAAGIDLHDVTEAIARLQDLRARGERTEAPPPRLPGAPAHSKLRESLAALGATRAEGELELIDGGVSQIVRVDGRGATHPLPFDLDLPVRAIIRSANLSESVLATEIATATVVLLRSLASSVDQLPPFVRARLRLLVCRGVQRGLAAPGDARFAAFVAKDGSFWSLAQLVELGTVRRTRDPETWSVQNPNAPIVCMSDDEAAALATVLRCSDVTLELREAQRGYERKTTTPLLTIALAGDLRARCLSSFVFDEGGMRGEVGLLRPASAERRGLDIHTTKRPVTTILDGAGWPIVAALDVDGLETNVGFDALADKSETWRIQRAVRALVAPRAGFLRAPDEAASVIRLPVPFMAKLGGEGATDLPVACLGIFWLPNEWPEAPTVHVEAADFVDPFRVPRAATRPGAHHGVLPIAGKVWVAAGQARADRALLAVWRFVHDRLITSMSAASPMSAALPAEREKYFWDLRLSGARNDRDPAVEMARDRPDPVLMHVAARRAPQLIDAATGDASPPAPQQAPETSALASEITPAETSAAPEVPVGESFLGGLVRWVGELVKPAPEPLLETALTRSLRVALEAMKLTGEPVAMVVESPRGRPIRYEAPRKRLVVNTSHASVRALEHHPARTLLLLAAAVSEINRELLPVTDAEELAVIVDLLRG